MIVFLYGSTVWGMFPVAEYVDPTISWEGHFSGALSGFLCALIFRKKGPQKPEQKYEWEEEEEKEGEGETTEDVEIELPEKNQPIVFCSIFATFTYFFSNVSEKFSAVSKPSFPE